LIIHRENLPGKSRLTVIEKRYCLPSEIYQKDRNVGRGDSGYTGSFTDGARSVTLELLATLDSKPVELIKIKVLRNLE
jgi:hypothetical protein